MKRILLIGNFLSRHIGTTAISETLSELLRSRNWDVITASSHQNRVFSLVDMLGTAWLRREEYDIAHVDVFSGNAFFWAEMVSDLLRMIGKPYILTFRSMSVAEFANRWPGRVHRLITRANRVMTPSHYLQQELMRFRNDIGYLPNGLDLQNYPFNLRKNPKPRLCWLRAFHKMYNPTMAVEVMVLLRETFPDIHLTMIGRDEEDGSFDAVRKIAEESGVRAHLHFSGSVPKVNVPLHLQKHDVFLNTTRTESFGVAVMEAAALGLPIVTTDVGELPLLWSNEENALLVSSNDAHAMAQAVRRILTEPGLAERLSGNARHKAEKYDWSFILPQWESLIEQVLNYA